MRFQLFMGELCLAHSCYTTAWLLCLAQNLVAVTVLKWGWEKIEISIIFQFWWKWIIFKWIQRHQRKSYCHFVLLEYSVYHCWNINPCCAEFILRNVTKYIFIFISQHRTCSGHWDTKAHSWGPEMGCLLWVRVWIYILPSIVGEKDPFTLHSPWSQGISSHTNDGAFLVYYSLHPGRVSLYCHSKKLYIQNHGHNSYGHT